MSIELAILGLLSWRPLTGYDLKKLFTETPALYWSGNNNQIYRTLVDLHKSGLVSMEAQHQERGPSRKVYTLTLAGHAELRKLAQAAPELPQLRHTFLIQLAWADLLSAAELQDLLAQYVDEVEAQLTLLKAQKKQARPTYVNPAQARTPREATLWKQIQDNWLAFYEHELAWVRKLRKELAEES